MWYLAVIVVSLVLCGAWKPKNKPSPAIVAMIFIFALFILSLFAIGFIMRPFR